MFSFLFNLKFFYMFCLGKSVDVNGGSWLKVSDLLSIRTVPAAVDRSSLDFLKIHSFLFTMKRIISSGK